MAQNQYIQQNIVEDRLDYWKLLRSTEGKLDLQFFVFV